MSYNFYLIIHLYQSGLFKKFLSNKKTIAYILEICVITYGNVIKNEVCHRYSSLPKMNFLILYFLPVRSQISKQTDYKSGESSKAKLLKAQFFYSAVTNIVSCYEVVYIVHCRRSRPNTVNNNKKKTEFVRAFKTILIQLNSFDMNWSLSLTSAQTFHKGFCRYIHFWFVKITDLFQLIL